MNFLPFKIEYFIFLLLIWFKNVINHKLYDEKFEIPNS